MKPTWLNTKVMLNDGGWGGQTEGRRWGVGDPGNFCTVEILGTGQKVWRQVQWRKETGMA
jgi:hypothetical protein